MLLPLEIRLEISQLNCYKGKVYVFHVYPSLVCFQSAPGELSKVLKEQSSIVKKSEILYLKITNSQHAAITPFPLV